MCTEYPETMEKKEEEHFHACMYADCRGRKTLWPVLSGSALDRISGINPNDMLETTIFRKKRVTA